MSRADGAVEDEALQEVADGEHQRQGDEGGERQRQAGEGHQRQDQEGGHGDEVAMGEVDQAHDAEDQREAGSEQRIEAAEQDALDDGVGESIMAPHSPKYAAWIASRVSSPAAGKRHAALLEAIDAVRHVQRLHDVLLDDDDGRALALMRRQRCVDVADDDGRQAERDFVAEQQARVGHQRAADGTICCWPPDSAVAGCVRRSRRIGNSS